VLRILPFTGITLPFVAYGGSSLFANYLIVALLLRISDENAQERRGGEIVAIKFKNP
jgi:cell division protein FtsW (lipid II flippase)